MTDQDIRWKQRFSNYRKALGQLNRAVEQANSRPLNELEQQGLIQAFEFTHEVAWNLLKDYFEYQGSTGLLGSRDATRKAFERGLIEEGETWMDMILSRNLTSHTYNEDVAINIMQKILSQYIFAFIKLGEKFAAIETS